MSVKKKVLPGDEVAVAEEYLPAEGTYEEDGIVYSALTGDLNINDGEKTVSVKAENPMAFLAIGDSVFCEVTDVRAAMAICEVVMVEGRSRGVSGDTNGTIHVSKISQDYVQDVGREYRPSDIIRARVVQVKPSIQLNTTSPHFGVVKSLCQVCRSQLRRTDKGLYCDLCEVHESRKIADDYGDVKTILTEKL
ncbi:MAG TPA: exosome complex RNA-binding protein Csl4 [Methanomassiliicoccales archaeon]|nr:exosome complex RNA-binding protein Csl4 [Methanomassiliicoccales archaeon]